MHQRKYITNIIEPRRLSEKSMKISKGVIRFPKSNERQCNVQVKKDKWRNNVILVSLSCNIISVSYWSGVIFMLY